MLWRLRVLFFYFSVSVLTITFVGVFFLPFKCLKISYTTKYNIATIFSRIFIWLGKIICGLDYQLDGFDKLPDTPCIALSNHQSFWDNVFMQIIIPKHSWIIKRELFNIPFFGPGLKLMEPVAVDRGANISVKQILRDGSDKILKEGLWMVVFPESTRLNPDQERKFKPSAIKLAHITKVPIVLIAHNAGVYWPKGFWIKRSGIIQVKCIEIINSKEVESREVRELTDYVEQVINKEKKILFEQTLPK
ncbi:MAG: lysophospholipid acyltransferase family protein [Rickettsiaceae bacterium]